MYRVEQVFYFLQQSRTQLTYMSPKPLCLQHPLNRQVTNSLFQTTASDLETRAATLPRGTGTASNKEEASLQLDASTLKKEPEFF